MIEGGCQCGAVRYAVDADADAVFVCHCRECRRQSASAFGLSVDVPADTLRLVQGTPQTWARPTPGGRLICHFCPTCGSRLWHVSEPPDRKITLKGGCMDATPDLTGAVHIWTARKLPGIPIPQDAEQHPGEPDRR